MGGSLFLIGVFLAALSTSSVWAQRGIEEEEELPCVMRKSFFAIHFAAYQARDAAGERFSSYCQDVPNTGKTTLVFDLIPLKMREMRVGVRIVEATEYSEPRTVASVPAKAYTSGVVTVEANFDKPGTYTTIVSLEEPEGRKAQAHGVDTLSFPLRVGMMPGLFTIIVESLGSAFLVLSLVGVGYGAYYYIIRRSAVSR
jgi:hypothetical protein